jgi:hypothetical protein
VFEGLEGMSDRGRKRKLLTRESKQDVLISEATGLK